MMNASAENIQVSIVYCDAERCHQQTLNIVRGSNIAMALQQSDMVKTLTLLEPLQVGIFGLKMPMDTVLQDGDRIEIYRPLTMNPKDIRRKRAEKHPVGRFLKGNQYRKQQIKANQSNQARQNESQSNGS
ncbi:MULTISPECIES: RnfH family protein [unclassified Acinetobacter]|uniref:RnfH family protein n=1 Tax=unclassified Acinetobacter TaxID=196816 RepID=UPI0035B882FA